jgi:hypothetical protein
MIVRPGWVAFLVGDAAEARAAHGGMLVGAHVVALGILTVNAGYRDLAIAAINAGVVFALSAAWAGAACGRAFALWRASALNARTLRACGLEAGLAILIAAPWVIWLIAALAA